MTRLRRGIAGAVAAVVVALTAVVQPTQPAAADDLSHKRQQTEDAIAAAEKRAADLEAALEDLSGALAQTAVELQAIEQQIPVAQARLDQAEATLNESLRKQKLIADQLADAQAQEATLGTQIADGDVKQQQIRIAIGEMARQAYRGQGDVTGLSMILDASSAEDFVDTYTMLGAAQRTQEEVFGQLADLEAANKNKAARLEAVREKITQLKAEADHQVAVAEQARQEAADPRPSSTGCASSRRARRPRSRPTSPTPRPSWRRSTRPRRS
jgi:septal ring factor EnvC (AmiA/AmiB activator)